MSVRPSSSGAVLEDHAVAASPGARRALPGERHRRRHPPLGLLVWAGFLAGALELAYTFSYAETHPSGQTEFALFWIGVFLFTVPAFLRLCQTRVARTERLAIVAATGLMDYLPKFLRSPTFPLFYDEHAHSRQAEVIASSGHLFAPNPIVPITEFFPGLHSLTVWLQHLTGVSQFQLNIGLMALAHAVALLGVFVIAETAFASSRIAGLAALIYSINPSFMWFNSEYAYESLAIVFFIWVTAAFMRLEASAGARARVGWFVTGLVLAGGCIVTHHLTSYFMVATLLLAQVLITLRARRGTRRRRRTARVTGAFTAAATLMTAGWVVFIASGTPGYLSPYFTGALRELVRLIYREQTTRTLFAQSTAPGYEKVSAYLAPVIVGVVAVVGIHLLWKRRPATPTVIALAVLGLAYFASLPVMLTNTGVEGAARTWAFSYLGLAMLLAPAVVWLLRRARSWPSRVARAAALAAATVAMAVVLIGNVTMHIDVEYRFPGPYVYGSDTRSLTAELIGTTNWFRTSYGIDQNLVTDRYTGLAFVSFGRDWWAFPSRGFPAWDLLLSRRLPSRVLLSQLRDSDYRYLVVDGRMARFVPRIGAYFLPGGGEPGAGTRQRPVPRAALSKFERLPWAIKVYASDHFSIYRFNFSVLDLDHLRKGWTR